MHKTWTHPHCITLCIFGTLRLGTVTSYTSIVLFQYSHNYEVCGVLLGTANLLVWLGVLRYLNFYEKYSVSTI